MDIWSKLIARYSRRVQVKGLQYGDPMGLLDLRETIAVYLRTARGVHCEAGQIMIVSGSQQALDLTTRVIVDPGAAVWVEEPGYWLVHYVLRAAGCRSVPVPVHAEGLNVAAGIRLNRKARAAFVAPSHQYPLGVTMSATRRLQLLEWAQRAGAWIVEDDYDSEYRYNSKPIASLQGMDQRDRVIYIGTFSKVMFPLCGSGTSLSRLIWWNASPPCANRWTSVRRIFRKRSCSNSSAKVILLVISAGCVRFTPNAVKFSLTSSRAQFGEGAAIIGRRSRHAPRPVAPETPHDRQLAARAAKESLWLSPLSASYCRANRRVTASCSASATRVRIRFLPRFGSSSGYARPRVKGERRARDDETFVVISLYLGCFPHRSTRLSARL